MDVCCVFVCCEIPCIFARGRHEPCLYGRGGEGGANGTLVRFQSWNINEPDVRSGALNMDLLITWELVGARRQNVESGVGRFRKNKK